MPLCFSHTRRAPAGDHNFNLDLFYTLLPHPDFTHFALASLSPRTDGPDCTEWSMVSYLHISSCGSRLTFGCQGDPI